MTEKSRHENALGWRERAVGPNATIIHVRLKSTKWIRQHKGHR